jgi:hypothetical protein
MNDRGNSQPRDVLSFGPFSLFPAERLLKKADKPIALGGRALDILIALVERTGEVVTNLSQRCGRMWWWRKAICAFKWLAFGRRLVTDETALARCRMLLVVGSGDSPSSEGGSSRFFDEADPQ